MNQIMLAGFLGRDPEYKASNNGPFYILSLGVKMGGKDKDTQWFSIFVSEELIGKMLPYLKKGSRLIVYGSLKIPRIYTNKEGLPAISMALTAHSLHFNPFPQKKETDETSPF